MEGGVRMKVEPVMEITEPMEDIHVAGPPPFLTKTYEMVENPETDAVVSWSESRNSFVVWDYIKFSAVLLPKYFKHSNFSSFIRQLNTYGFRKVDPDRFEFANEGFLGGQRHLLRTIIRRRHVGLSSPHQGVAGWRGVEGFGEELGMLKRERKMLLTDVLVMKQQQLDVKEHIVEMQERLLRTETKQQQMASFLSRAVSNPLILEQFLEGCAKRRALVCGVENRRKRRLMGSCNPENLPDEMMSGMGNRGYVNFACQHQAEELMNVDSESKSLFSCGMENDVRNEIRYSKMDTVAEENDGYNNWDSVNGKIWEDLPSEELVNWDADYRDDLHSGDQMDLKISLEDSVSPIVFESGDDVEDLFDQMNYLDRSHTPIHDNDRL